MELSEEAYTLGRARDNDVCLSVTTVSGHHAALVRKEDGYWLEDLLSTNGSYINGVRVQRRRLKDGDVLELADCRIEYFEIVEPEPEKEERTKLYTGAMIEQSRSGRTPTVRQRHRKGESGEIPYRSGRFFCAGGKWYFSTREGDDVGPFESLDLARAGLVEYGRKVGFLAGFDDDFYSM